MCWFPVCKQNKKQLIDVLVSSLQTKQKTVTTVKNMQEPRQTVPCVLLWSGWGTARMPGMPTHTHTSAKTTENQKGQPNGTG